MKHGGERLTGREPLQLGHAETIIDLNLVVVGGIGEGARQDPLFLEIGQMQAGEALGDDQPAAQIARRHGRMLAA